MRVLSLLLLAACVRPEIRPQPPLPSAVEAQCQAAELRRRPDPEVRALLDASLAATRVRAALAVGRIGDAQAIDRLAQLLLDAEVGETAAWALGRVDGGVPALLRCLSQPCASASAAARALAGPVAGKTPQAEALVAALSGPAVDEAAFALGILARNPEAKFPPRTWAALAAALPRAGAAYALSRLPKGGANGLQQPLLEALRSADPWARALAARAWGRQGLPAEGLARAFDDPDWRVRVEAARGLATAPGAVALLSFTAPRQTSPHVLVALFEAAAQLGPEALPALSLASPDPVVRCASAQARDRIRKQLIDTPLCDGQGDWRSRARTGALAAELGLLEPARAAMQDPDGRVRGAAAGAAGPLLSAELHRLLADPDRYVVEEAQGALAKDSSSPAVQNVPALVVPPEARSAPAARRLRLRTSRGELLVDLRPEVAPLTSSALAALAGRHFYDGLTFHRVVPDFVVQGGDPRGDGDGGPAPGWAIPDEHSPLRFLRGTLGIATSGPETGGSQFFLCHSPQPHLDGRYTIAGQLASGDDVLDALEPGDTILAATAE